MKPATPRLCSCGREAAKARLICGACIARKRNERDPVAMCYHRKKYNAKRDGIPFELTQDQFREFAVETEYVYRRGRTVTGYHIDRIDPLKGYTLDNIRMLPASDNSRKGATIDKQCHQQHRQAVLQRWYNDNTKQMEFWMASYAPVILKPEDIPPF